MQKNVEGKSAGLLNGNLKIIHNTLKTSKKNQFKIFVFLKFLYLCLPKKWG